MSTANYSNRVWIRERNKVLCQMLVDEIKKLNSYAVVSDEAKNMIPECIATLEALVQKPDMLLSTDIQQFGRSVMLIIKFGKLYSYDADILCLGYNIEGEMRFDLREVLDSQYIMEAFRKAIVDVPLHPEKEEE